MKTLNLKIDDNFFPQFKALVDSYVNEHKIEIIKDENLRRTLINKGIEQSHKFSWRQCAEKTLKEIESL